MRKLAASFLFLTVALLALTPPNPVRAVPAVDECQSSAARSESSFDKNRLAAIMVRVYTNVNGKAKLQALGSGIILGVDGLVLTNQHVAEFGKEKDLPGFRLEVCLVEGPAKICTSATTVAASEKDDLAILRTKLNGQGPIVLRPDAEYVREAEIVYARPGFAFYLTASLVYGRYVGLEPEWGSDLYDLATMPGSSGGPVFDLKDRLVGLIRARTTEKGTPFSVVVPVPTIRKFLADHGYKF